MLQPLSFVPAAGPPPWMRISVLFSGTAISVVRLPRTIPRMHPSWARTNWLSASEDGIIEVTAESTIRSTETDFHVTVNLHVTRNGLPFFQKQWLLTEPRRLL
jgi:hypothetical protein